MLTQSCIIVVLLISVISWFLSPLLSGFVSILFYLFIDHAVLRRRHPLRCGLILLPILYFVCVAVNIFAVMFNGSECKFILSFRILLSFGINGCIASKLIVFFKYSRQVWCSPPEKEGYPSPCSWLLCAFLMHIAIRKNLTHWIGFEAVKILQFWVLISCRRGLFSW